jgi:hypothetical protein
MRHVVVDRHIQGCRRLSETTHLTGGSCNEVSTAIRCVAYPLIVAKRQSLVLALFIYVILQ